jgi:phosphopantetheinyl transferase
VRATVAGSIGARNLLRRTAARALGKREDALLVTRPPVPGSWDGFGPPELSYSGRPLDVDVSLSHDGHYVACALIHGGG